MTGESNFAQGVEKKDVAGEDLTTGYQPPEGIGTRIGPYKLLQAIGEGGMGAVYLAEQEQPVRRRVALKIIKPGMDTKQVIARFEAERQALALMDHPNIARVFEAGTTDSGRPYFVMELVKGIPITRFCDQEHLTARERLNLFLPVCLAVQHAHQKGVIHRDLKPSNILVALYDGVAVPKVIDFGVAKAVSQKLSERTLFTEVGQVVGTIEYMSPEQAELNNLDIDTRSDIYSLGVLLYELLTGTTPLERKKLRGATHTEMLRMIREEEPPRPSTRLSESKTSLPSIAAQRKTEPAKLTKLVRGELDWIVMKALEKDRSRRYVTANSFARDVERYLRDERVEASPPSTAYRLRKFLRRNKLKVAAAILAVGGLLLATGGLTFGLLQTRRAADVAEREATKTRAALDQVSTEKDRTQFALERLQQEQQKTREALASATRAKARTEEALNALTDDVIENLFARQPALGEAEKEFLRKILGFYEDFTREEGVTPEAQLFRAVGYLRVGSIRHHLGELKDAEAALRNARQLFVKIVADQPRAPGPRNYLGQCHNNLGNLLGVTGRLREAEAAYRDALSVQTQLVRDFPDKAEHRRDLAIHEYNLGKIFHDTGRNQEAELMTRKALGHRKKLVADFPDVAEYRRDLAQSHRQLGVLLDSTDRSKEAVLAFRAALAIWEELTRDFPDVAEYRSGLGRTCNSLGLVLNDLRRPKEAETAFRAALSHKARLASDYPTVREYRGDLANTHNSLGILLYHQGRLKEAEAAYREALTLWQKLVAENASVLDHATSLGGAYCNLGLLTRDQNRPRDALEWFGKAISTLESVVARDARHAAARRFLLTSHHGRAVALERLKRHKEALDDWDVAIKLAQGQKRSFYQWHRVDCLVSAGELSRATRAADELVAAPNTPGGACVAAACIYARCSQAVAGDAQRKEELAAHAVRLLRRAERSGFFNDKKVRDRLRTEADLDSLRQRDDFKRLFAEMPPAHEEEGPALRH
jgi:serine/threonine protein kinase/tetratricopeptide (TPR) repeat protein